MSEPISFEDYLDTHDTLTYTNVGVSMLPLLRQGKDLFTVRKKGPERCHVGDVVLYHRPPNSYVLHRVVEVRTDDYVILGDNCIAKEYGIKDVDILGVMTEYVRNGHKHSTGEWGYRLYSNIILRTIGMRSAIKRCKTNLARQIKKRFKSPDGATVIPASCGARTTPKNRNSPNSGA